MWIEENSTTLDESTALLDQQKTWEMLLLFVVVVYENKNKAGASYNSFAGNPASCDFQRKNQTGW